MIDRRSGRALFQQVADSLRASIAAGDLLPGAELPIEQNLAASCKVSREVVREALATLVNEGLVVTRRGRPTVVRPQRPVEVLPIPSDSRIRARMPTPDERARFDLTPGVPVLAVFTADGQVVYAADCTELRSPS
jgi:DNA-binding GntR family transcriptional regulator